MNKGALILRIELALDENIYCGDVCYNRDRGEYCEIEGKKEFMEEIERVVEEYE